MSNSEDKSLRVWDMSKRIGVQVRALQLSVKSGFILGRLRLRLGRAQWACECSWPHWPALAAQVQLFRMSPRRRSGGSTTASGS